MPQCNNKVLVSSYNLNCYSTVTYIFQNAKRNIILFSERSVSHYMNGNFNSWEFCYCFLSRLKRGCRQSAIINEIICKRRAHFRYSNQRQKIVNYKISENMNYSFSCVFVVFVLLGGFSHLIRKFVIFELIKLLSSEREVSAVFSRHKIYRR